MGLTMAPVASVGGWFGAVLRELALWAGVLLLLVGGLSLYRGYARRQLSELVDETPESDVTEVRSEGTARVRGRVVPRTDRDTFESPIKGDEDCVLSAWEIRELYDAPKSNSWENAARGVRSVPFALADDTGKILVDIDDTVVGNETGEVVTPEAILASAGVATESVHCEFETFDVHLETGYDESPPGRTAEFLARTDGVSLDPMVSDFGGSVVDGSKRRYLEETVQAGDEISIVGSVVPRRQGAEVTTEPSDLVFTASADTPLRISERPFEELTDGGGLLLFGILAGLAGGALLALRFVV